MSAASILAWLWVASWQVALLAAVVLIAERAQERVLASINQDDLLKRVKIVAPKEFAQSDKIIFPAPQLWER